MTTYMFTLSDKTPAVEIDVKETAIVQGAGQDLYDRAKKELGYTGTFGEFLATFKGERGVDGKSVYELALENGFTGNLDQWLKSLRGLDGLAGENGADGKSAYELAGGDDRFGISGVDGFLKSLIGATGAKGDKGDTGARGADGLPGAKGDTGERGQDGKSAYEIAVANGYVGNEAQWLASLKGRDGERGRDGQNGKSAFEIAEGDLYFGTEEKWLASLKGAKGDTGQKGSDGKSATVTIGTVTTGEAASVTNTGTGTDAVLNFVLPAGGGGNNGLHTEIRTIPVTVNAQQIQTVEFESKFAETPTLHGQPALMGAGENRFLYLLSVDKNGFTCRSNYFSAGIQTIHYAVTGKLS